MRKKVTTLDKNDTNMEQVVKRKRNRPDLQQFGYELAEPGDNSKATMFIQALNKFDRVDLSDENAVKQRIDEFWQLCIDFDTKHRYLVWLMCLDLIGGDYGKLLMMLSGETLNAALRQGT